MEEFRRTTALRVRSVGTWVFPMALGAMLLASSPPRQEPETPAADAPIVIRNLSLPGAFEIENRGPDIELAGAISVQRQLKGQWGDEVTDLMPGEKCEANPRTGCVPLPRGAKLRPVRWNGLTCGSQCPATCRANLYLGPGRFRFVASSCDGKRKFFGAAFEMPSRDKWK
jgi:hypothetical protein